MSQSVIRIERKDARLPEAAEQLRRALMAADRPDVTPAEAAAVCGLPLELCQEALLHLASELAPRVRVSDAGTLRFTFTHWERPRPDARARLAGWLRRHAAGLKLTGLLLLVPPFFLTVAAHALALADLPPRYGALAAVLAPVGWLVAVPAFVVGVGSFFFLQLMPAMGLAGLGVSLFVLAPTWLRDPGGDVWGLVPTGLLLVVTSIMGVCGSVSAFLLFRHYVFGTRNLFGMRLWRHVSGMLFGGDLARGDALSDERRLTALIARRDGVLTTADLIALFGWTPEEADGQLARILLDYGGDVVVTDAGAIAYRFPALAATEAPPEVDTRPCYEREATYPAFWQAPTAFVRGFWALAAVGALGLALHPGRSFWPDWTAPGSLSDQVLAQAFGGVPYAVVLAIVLVRAWLHRRGGARHAERAPFLRLVRLAVEHPEGRYLKRVPERLLVRLGGTIDPDRTRADGQLWVHFPALAAGLRAAGPLRAELRQASEAASAPGVAFDTAGA